MTLSVHSNSIKWALLAVVVSFVAACSIYKPDITQGNIITNEQVSELKLGMSRQQVQQILGSPLLQDTFNTNRWDYVYRFLKGNGSLEQRVMTVFFDANGKLERWSGLVAPEQKDISLKPLSPAKTLAIFSPSATPASTASLSAEIIASGGNQSIIVPAPMLEQAAVPSPQPQPPRFKRLFLSP
jgi:outer membrane protein assembly factor BamE